MIVLCLRNRPPTGNTHAVVFPSLQRTLLRLTFISWRLDLSLTLHPLCFTLNNALTLRMRPHKLIQTWRFNYVNRSVSSQDEQYHYAHTFCLFTDKHSRKTWCEIIIWRKTTVDIHQNKSSTQDLWIYLNVTVTLTVDWFFTLFCW